MNEGKDWEERERKMRRIGGVAESKVEKEENGRRGLRRGEGGNRTEDRSDDGRRR